MDSNELLEKIEAIRERMDVSYKEARETLEQAGGDLVEALVLLETRFEEESGRMEALKEGWTRKIQGKGEEVLGCLKTVMEKGTSTKILLKQGDRTLLEIPAGIGVLGVAGMLMSTELAVIGALGTVAALIGGCTLEVEGIGELTQEEVDDRPVN